MLTRTPPGGRTGPKIAFVDCFPSWGGGQVELTARMQALREAGYESLLVCPRQSPYTGSRKPANVQVVGLPIGESITDWSGRPQWGRAFREYVGFTLALARILSSAAPVIVHAVGSRSAKAVLATVAILRLPLTWSAGNLYSPGRLDRLLVHRSAAVFCPSEAIRQQYRGSGSDFSRTYFLPNSVDAGLFATADGTAFRTELGLSPRDVLVGVVGRVSASKGQLEFVEAVLPLIRQWPWLHAAVVGAAAKQDEAYYDRLRQVVRDSGRAGQIHLMGQRSDIPSVMRGLDIFVLASHGEGFGIVLIEAMAAGRPVIANRQGSVPEIVEHGANGLHVDIAHEGSLMSAIQALCLDPALRRALGEAGQARAFEMYDRRKILPRFVRIVDDVIRAHGRR